MQDPHKVKLVDASPETREKLKIFLSQIKIKEYVLEGKKIKTLEDAVLFAIEQAEKVPKLEKRIKELEAEIERIELQHEVDMTEYDTGDE